MYVPFGKWLPDQPRSKPGHLIEAKNCVPLTGGGYGPAPMPEADDLSMGALPAAAQGAASFLDPETGQIGRWVAGTQTKLYQMTTSGGAWTDASRASGGDYDLTEEIGHSPLPARWRFSNFEDSILAVGRGQDIQTKTIIGANFAALGGSPPHAIDVTTFGDFVVIVCDSDSGAGVDRNEIAWSASGDPTGWTSGVGLSDRRKFYGLGPAFRVVTVGGVLYVFFKYGILRGLFVGPPEIIHFDEVGHGVGLLTPNSLAVWGDRVFFLSNDGPYQLRGDGAAPLGAGMMKKWLAETFAEFLDQPASGSGQAAFRRIEAALDPLRDLVYWGIPSQGSASPDPDSLLAFNYVENAASIVPGVSLTSMFTDIIPFSAFSPTSSIAGAVAEPRVAGFSGGTALRWLSGPASATATFETSDIVSLENGRRIGVRAARPNTGGAATVALAARETEGATATFGAAVATGSSGRASVRASGRYVNARVTIAPGSFSDENAALGIEVDIVDRGRR